MNSARLTGATTKLLAVPIDEVQRKIQKHKKRNKKSNISESAPSRDSGGGEA